MDGFIKQPFGFVMKVEFSDITLPRRATKAPTVPQYQDYAFWPLGSFAPIRINGGTFEVYCVWDATGNRWVGSWTDPNGTVIEVVTYAKQPRSTGANYSESSFVFAVPELLKNAYYSGPEQAGTYINIYNDTNRPNIRGDVTIRGISQSQLATIGGGKLLPDFEIPLQDMEFVFWSSPAGYFFEGELASIYKIAIGSAYVYYPTYGRYKFTPPAVQSVIGVKTQRSDIAVFNDGEPFYPAVNYSATVNTTSVRPTKDVTGDLILYHHCTTYESTFISWNEAWPQMFAVKIVGGVPTSYLAQIRGWGEGTEIYGGLARGMWSNRGSPFDDSLLMQRYSVTNDLVGPDYYPDIGDILHFEDGYIYPGGGWRAFDVQVVLIDENDPDQRNLSKPVWYVDTTANSTAFYQNEADVNFDIVSGTGSVTVDDFSPRVYAASVMIPIEFVSGTLRTSGPRFNPNKDRIWGDTLYVDEDGSLVNAFSSYVESGETLDLPHRIEVLFSLNPEGYYELFDSQTSSSYGVLPAAFLPMHLFEVPHFNNNSPKWSKTLEYIDTVSGLTGYEQTIPITASLSQVLWDPVARETIEEHENDI